MNIFEQEKELFIQTYKRIPLEIAYGRGVYLYDTAGAAYLDFFSGLAVNSLGYAHPRIVEAVSRQIGQYAHLSNNYITPIQIEFTGRLIKYSGMDKAFLTNSGTEAVEGAIKLIRMHSGPEEMIYSLSDDFHGRTYGALSLTQREKYQKGFEPLLPNTGVIRFNDINDLNEKANANTAAVFVECIQGEGGINEVSKEFADQLMKLRERFGFIIVSDCIQCGFGRTGKTFGHDHIGLMPDIIVAAKAIGGGLPLGALLVKEKYANVFKLGKHGTTFGGNSVCCAAGNVVLEEVFERGLLNTVKKNGDYFKNKLLALKEKYPDKIADVRGKGYMLGVELKFPGASVVDEMFKRKILTNCTNNTVIRILPPLIAGMKEIDIFLAAFEEVIRDMKF